ncbi:MAG: hypothetical protein ACXWQE_04300 [Bdellovibrionales bacterium]
MQTDNSSALDANTYGAGGSGAIKKIFTARCTPCHGYQSMDNDALVAAGVVVKGSPSTSKIYYRLTGATSGPGPQNMPQTGSISAAEVAQIEAWITGMQ